MRPWLVPVNVGGKHWVLCIVWFVEGRGEFAKGTTHVIEVWDSMGHAYLGRVRDELETAMKVLLCAAHATQGKPMPVIEVCDQSEDLVQQNASVSCGAMVLGYMRYLLGVGCFDGSNVYQYPSRARFGAVNERVWRLAAMELMLAE